MLLFPSLSQFGIAIGVIVSFLILIYPMARPKVKVSSGLHGVDDGDEEWLFNCIFSSI